MAGSVDLDTILADNGISKDSQIMRSKIALKDRNKIAVKIGDWESCAAFLGLHDQDIADIADEYKRKKQQRIAMLRQWYEQNGREATYLSLAEALANIGRRDVIEDLVSKAIRCHTHLTMRTRRSQTYRSAVSCKYKCICL